MSKVDLVSDLTRVGRLLKKVTQGDMSVGELFFGMGKGAPDVPAGEGEPTCQQSPGCVCAPGHEGGCVFDEVPAPPEV